MPPSHLWLSMFPLVSAFVSVSPCLMAQAHRRGCGPVVLPPGIGGGQSAPTRRRRDRRVRLKPSGLPHGLATLPRCAPVIHVFGEVLDELALAPSEAGFVEGGRRRSVADALRRRASGDVAASPGTGPSPYSAKRNNTLRQQKACLLGHLRMWALIGKVQGRIRQFGYRRPICVGAGQTCVDLDQNWPTSTEYWASFGRFWLNSAKIGDFDRTCTVFGRIGLVSTKSGLVSTKFAQMSEDVDLI